MSQKVSGSALGPVAAPAQSRIEATTADDEKQ